MKYIYSRKELYEIIKNDMGFDLREFKRALFATKEPCLHDHLCCPGDIKTVRCAYCGKSMYQEPFEIEGLETDYCKTPLEIQFESKINEIINYLKKDKPNGAGACGDYPTGTFSNGGDFPIPNGK